MTWLRRRAPVLLAVYSVLLAVALFSPTSEQQNAAVLWLSHGLVAVGIPAQLVPFGRLEVLMNVVIVAPVTMLASVIRPGPSWRDWTALGFIVAISVEVVQGMVLPERQMAFSDVVANTAGALVGASVVSLIRPMLRSKTTV